MSELVCSYSCRKMSISWNVYEKTQYLSPATFFLQGYVFLNHGSVDKENRLSYSMVVIMLVVPCAKWRDEPFRGSPADVTEVGEGTHIKGRVLLV